MTGTHRGQLARQQVAVLGQHVGHHDGREVHGLVGVGREQSVGRKAVAQRVVAGFVVPQMQEGWFREVGRCYRGDLIVFVALILAVVGLKHHKGTLSRVSVLQLQNMGDSTNNSNNSSDHTCLAKERRDDASARQTVKKAMTCSDSCPIPKWVLPPPGGSAYKQPPSRWASSYLPVLFSHQIWPLQPTMNPSPHTHPSYRWENCSDPRRKVAQPRLAEVLGIEPEYPDSLPSDFPGQLDDFLLCAPNTQHNRVLSSWSFSSW